jgi:hypothetical protein
MISPSVEVDCSASLASAANSNHNARSDSSAPGTSLSRGQGSWRLTGKVTDAMASSVKGAHFFPPRLPLLWAKGVAAGKNAECKEAFDEPRPGRGDLSCLPNCGTPRTNATSGALSSWADDSSSSPHRSPCVRVPNRAALIGQELRAGSFDNDKARRQDQRVRLPSRRAEH